MTELNEKHGQEFSQHEKEARAVELYEKIKTDFLDKVDNASDATIKTYLDNLYTESKDTPDEQIVKEIISGSVEEDLYVLIFSEIFANHKATILKSFEQLISRNSPKFIRDNKDAIRDVAQIDLLEDPLVLDLGVAKDRDMRIMRLAKAHAILGLKKKLENEGKQKTKGYINLIEALNAPANIEKQELDEKSAQEIIDEEPQVSLRPQAIPRVGGIITLPILVDADGIFHAKNYVVEKPGKNRLEKLVIDFGAMRAPKGLIGEVNLSFKLVSNKDGVLMLDEPGHIFENKDEANDYRERFMVRPVAYVRESAHYVLPDGYYFAISPDDIPKIDVETGFSKTQIGLSLNKFPVVDIVKTRQIRPDQNPEYIGNILSPEEFDYRQMYEELFEHYFQRSKRGVFDKYDVTQPKEEFYPKFSLAQPRRDWLSAAAEIRAISQKFPIEIVVSGSATSIGRGFGYFETEFARIVRTDENAELVDRLQNLFVEARKTHDLFEKQKQTEKQSEAREFFKNPDAWKSYIEFFRLLETDEVRQLFGHKNIRQALFVSDLDGETAVQFFGLAGIKTTVIPFVPDQKRRGAYVSSAVHLDISHGIGNQVYFNARGPWNGVTVFLDEDNKHVYSAAHATYIHLMKLGLLESDPVAPYLVDFIDDHDSYRGIYASKDGAEAILQNEFKNIYGIGGVCVGSGQYEAVLDFFKKYVPEMEAHIIKKNPDSAKNRDVLRKLVLKELVKFDVRPFFRSYLGEKIDQISDDLEKKRESSRAALDALITKGFVSDSIFGKTLWDPFGAVEHQGLGAFVGGFDCYVSYNRKSKLCMVNLSPIPSPTAKRKDIPTDLFVSRNNKRIGQVIKGGRYLVMNSSSQRVESFGFVVDSIIGYSNATPAIKEYCDNEADEDRQIKDNQRPGRLIYTMYGKVVPQEVRNRAANRLNIARSLEPIKTELSATITIPEEVAMEVDAQTQSESEKGVDVMPPISAEFVEAQKSFSSHIASIDANRAEAFSAKTKELRRMVAHEFEKMASAAAAHPTPESSELLRVAREAMFEDARETLESMMEILESIKAYDFENPKDMVAFYNELKNIASEDSGLTYYEAVIGLSLPNDSEELKTK